MDLIWEKFTEWLKELLVGGIMDNLTGLFDNVNAKVAEAAGHIGSTPQAWNANIYSMIRSLSDNVILPIAGVILAFVMTLELIQLIADRNNLHDIDTWVFFRWVFKTAAAVLIVSNTWNIVMGVFEAAQSVVNRASGLIVGNGKVEGCKAKDMIGIPWLLAFALRADGWYLRSDIIWMKANPMPESTKDRPSRCYEHIFLLSKSRRYYYDAAAIAEPVAETTVRRMKGARSTATKHGSGIPGQQNIQKINLPRAAGTYTDADIPQLRNKRDVWQINTVPYRGGHFAAFPPKLAETCLLAGCPPEGVVLDPFLGSGTTAAVARQLGRHYIGIELNPDYCKLAEKRIGGVTV